MNCSMKKNITVVLTTAVAFLFSLIFSQAVLAAEKKETEKTSDVVKEVVKKEAPKEEVSLELGRKVYNHYCTPCHGVNGDGNGFNAPKLLVKPANHTDAKFMSERSDQKLFDVVNLGGVEVAKSTLMPPWGAVLGDVKLKSVVLRLRELCQCQANKNW